MKKPLPTTWNGIAQLQGYSRVTVMMASAHLYNRSMHLFIHREQAQWRLPLLINRGGHPCDGAICTEHTENNSALA